MAWIESHQELGRHPKTKKLARTLQISIPAAVGHLQFLWWWALDYAQDGDLTEYDNEDIADAAMWEGNPREFTEALIYARFIDKENDATIIHDWREYAGKLIERRAADRERKQKAKEFPQEFQGNSDGKSEDSFVTVPNPTVPNPTEPDIIFPPEKNSDGETDRDNSKDGDDIFNKIYDCYPKKGSKSDGKSAFMGYLTNGRKLKGQGNVKFNHLQIYYAIKAYAAEVQNKDEQYIKGFGTFMGSINGMHPIIDYVETTKPIYEQYMLEEYGADWRKVKFKYNFKGVKDTS